MTHGGARKGAGRPKTAIDERRLLVLRSEGFTMSDIAKRFGVSQHIIKYRLDKIKNEQTRQRHLPDHG